MATQAEVATNLTSFRCMNGCFGIQLIVNAIKIRD